MTLSASAFLLIMNCIGTHQISWQIQLFPSVLMLSENKIYYTTQDQAKID